MWKKILAISIIVVTLGFFGYYLWVNPDLLETVMTLSPLTLLGLTFGYLMLMIVNAFILHWSLQLIKHRIDYFENLIVTGYSSIVNFFGPLQSGSGFRGIYLKKKHNVRLRDFFATLILFYVFFIILNGVILLIALLNLHGSAVAYSLSLGGVVLAALVGVVAYKKVPKLRQALTKFRINDPLVWKLCLGALLSILATVIIYHVQLVHVAPETSIMQTLIYTAAANFALFVAITPGAIGFRESFVLVTQQLHGIDTNAIIGASVIDRAFYVAFLLVLFVTLLAINSYKHLSVLDKA